MYKKKQEEIKREKDRQYALETERIKAEAAMIASAAEKAKADAAASASDAEKAKAEAEASALAVEKAKAEEAKTRLENERQLNQKDQPKISLESNPTPKRQPPTPKPSYKSKAAALREICQAGKEYAEDGLGTSQQIAHELAYWVIDLHKQTGGAASEGQLKRAGSHGYMYENCSKY